MADTPGQEFIDDASNAVAAPASSPPDEPRVPFQTSLALTREQEDKMMDHAFKRMHDVENEMGRELTLSPTWWANLQPTPNQAAAAQGFLQASTHLGKRSRYEATFENDVSWRPWTMGVDNIFMSSNLTVPLARRITRQMIARAKDQFFGNDPWMAVDPTPGTATLVDDEMAERIQRFSQFKLKESGAKYYHGNAAKRALVLGECAVKTSYVVRDQIFNTEAQVLTDVTGTRINGADGNAITQSDKWEDQTDDVGNTRKILSRDKQTAMPDAPIWTKQPLNRRQVLFEGARSEPIYYKDFICPLTAKSVQEADLCAHFYDKNVMEFVDLVVKRGMVDGSTDSRLATARRIMTLVQAMGNNSPQPKSASTMAIRPNENYTAQPSSSDSAGPVAQFAEIYMWYDADGDGIAENVMLIVDKKNKLPIYYDHVANVTTDGLRPIEIVRVNPVDDRWYGMGIMELFETYQTVTDLLVNRWNFSQSRSGRVDLWTPTNTLEGDRDPSLKMNWGGTYTKKPGMKAEDVLETIYLNDTKFEQIHEMIEFFMQLAMNESGVTNANDDQAAGMQSAKLATGILEVKKSGDELFKPIIEDLTGPLESLLNREIDVILANMNPTEVFTYLDGDTMGVDKLTADDVRGLKFKCSISLNTHKNQQVLQQSAQAAELVKQFYSEYSPAQQVKVAQLFKDQIRALCPKVNVDTIIQPDQPAPPAPPPADPIKPSMSVAAKMELLPPAVQEQLLAKMDIHETESDLAAANAKAAALNAKPGDGKKPAAATSPVVKSTNFEAQLGQQKSQPKGVAA